MKLCIDPGHGGHDSGATFRGLLEKDVVLDIALRVGAMALKSHSMTVLLTRTTDLYLGRIARAGIANEWNADAFLSVHANADPDQDQPGDPEARGIETLYWHHSARGRLLAEAVGWSLVDEMCHVEPWRGAKPRNDLAVLQHTDAPAIIAEVGFLDREETARSFADPEVLDRIAFGLFRGVLWWEGLSLPQTPPVG